MRQAPQKDPFQFGFWLGWILWFAGSLAAAGGLWTWFLTRFFGQVRGEELTMTWAAAVFGSWFLLVVPFMRKKERIWKRLNQDQEKAVDAWLGAMSLLIAFLIASCVFWSWKRSAAIAAQGLDGTWLKAVLGTWMLAVMPLLVFMYRKADLILKEAVARQTHTGPKFRTGFVEKSRRLLAPAVKSRLKDIPQTLPQGHIVTAVLSDGRKIPHVFVLNASEILGIYDREAMDFEAGEIVGVEPVEDLPPYEEARWLRLDGRA
jgi:hypothetical protein